MKTEYKERITASTDFYRDLNMRAQRAMERRREDEALAVRKMMLRDNLEAQERRAYGIVGWLVLIGALLGVAVKLMGLSNA